VGVLRALGRERCLGRPAVRAFGPAGGRAAGQPPAGDIHPGPGLGERALAV